MKKSIEINVRNDFGPIPGGAKRSGSDHSGEAFREDLLVPALRENDVVIVVLTRLLGPAASWLEEVFGGLIRENGFTMDTIEQKLSVVTDNPLMEYSIRRYIEKAWSKVVAAGYVVENSTFAFEGRNFRLEKKLDDSTNTIKWYIVELIECTPDGLTDRPSLDDLKALLAPSIKSVITL